MVRKDETVRDYHLRLAEKCEITAIRHLSSISSGASDRVRKNNESRADHERASAVRHRELAESVA